jgi:hypothetical protein
LVSREPVILLVPGHAERSIGGDAVWHNTGRTNA